jgi:hypothetical protein
MRTLCCIDAIGLKGTSIIPDAGPQSNTAEISPPAMARRACHGGLHFLEETLTPTGDSCFDATHKKSLDLIFEDRKIGFVALHNLLIGLKRG